MERVREYVIVILLVVSLISIGAAKHYYTEYTICETQLDTLVAAVKANEQNSTKVAELPQKVAQVRTVYKDRLVYIDSWTEDKNVTECSNSIDMLREFDYTSGL